MPSHPSANKALLKDPKTYIKEDIKFFCFSSVLLDFLTLVGIFCPRLKILSHKKIPKKISAESIQQKITFLRPRTEKEDDILREYIDSFFFFFSLPFPSEFEKIALFY